MYAGVTTVVDAGSAGCYTFGGFPQHIVPNAKTRIVCMLHISRAGLNFQPEIAGRDDIDLEETVRVIEANKPLVQGSRSAQSGRPCRSWEWRWSGSPSRRPTRAESG